MDFFSSQFSLFFIFSFFFFALQSSQFTSCGGGHAWALWAWQQRVGGTNSVSCPWRLPLNDRRLSSRCLLPECLAFHEMGSEIFILLPEFPGCFEPCADVTFGIAIHSPMVTAFRKSSLLHATRFSF